MTRVVIDTNVFVSAVLIPDQNPGRILDLWRQRRFVLLVSFAILEEIRKVLKVARLRHRHDLTDQEIDAFVADFGQAAVVVAVETGAAVVDKDPDDSTIIACALAGGADVVVSGDNHLLNLKHYRSIQILSPAAFLRMLQPAGGT